MTNKTKLTKDFPSVDSPINEEKARHWAAARFYEAHFQLVSLLIQKTYSFLSSSS